MQIAGYKNGFYIARLDPCNAQDFKLFREASRRFYESPESDCRFSAATLACLEKDGSEVFWRGRFKEQHSTHFGLISGDDNGFLKGITSVRFKVLGSAYFYNSYIEPGDRKK